MILIVHTHRMLNLTHLQNWGQYRYNTTHILDRQRYIYHSEFTTYFFLRKIQKRTQDRRKIRQQMLGLCLSSQHISKEKAKELTKTFSTRLRPMRRHFSILKPVCGLDGATYVSDMQKIYFPLVITYQRNVKLCWKILYRKSRNAENLQYRRICAVC